MDARGTRWIENTLQDLRIAARSLRSTPIVSIAAALSLTLGVGANTALFSLVNSLLLRTLPVSDPNRLVSVSAGPEQSQQAFSFATWEQFQRTGSFDGALAWAPPSRLRLTRTGEPEMVDALWISGDAFRTLGLPAVVGRTFTAADDVRGGGPDGPVAMISYQMWQQRFGGSANVVGMSITVERIPATIVGVTPPEFFGLEVGRTFDVALPVYAQPLVRGSGGITQDQPWMRVMLRLKRGQSIESATAALRAAQPQIRASAMPLPPEMRPGFLSDPFLLESASSGISALRSRYGRPLMTVFAAAALVLFVACANIANLMLARGNVRRHEMSVRLALGASRGRLVRQLLVESGMLAVVGAIGGLAFSTWAGPAIVARLPTSSTRMVLDLSLDWRVMTFTALTMVATVLLFGVAPALRATRVAPMEAVKEHGRKAAGAARTNLSSGLVVAQVAVSLTLVVAAGLFVRTIAQLAQVPLGFDRDRVLVVSMDAARATMNEADRTGFYYRLVDTVAAVPGVSHVGGSLGTPMGVSYDFPFFVSLSTEPASESQATAQLYGITPGWISTYGTTLRSGRDIASQDDAATQPVMLVNEAFVRKFVPNRSPIGTTLALAFGTNRELPIGSKTIVGVIADMAWQSPRAPAPPTMYVPVTQWMNPLHPTSIFYISVRSETGSPALLTQRVTSALHAVDRNLLLTVRPLADQVNASLAQERLVAVLSGFFGGLGLLLAGLGLYGVTSHAVGQRRTEIGIRLALGAAPGNVVALVLSRVALLVGAGVIIGVGASAGLSQLVATLLYGVDPRDPITLSVGASTLFIVGVLAGWLPAYRASRLDPTEVLRNT